MKCPQCSRAQDCIQSIIIEPGPSRFRLTMRADDLSYSSGWMGCSVSAVTLERAINAPYTALGCPAIATVVGAPGTGFMICFTGDFGSRALPTLTVERALGQEAPAITINMVREGKPESVVIHQHPVHVEAPSQVYDTPGGDAGDLHHHVVRLAQALQTHGNDEAFWVKITCGVCKRREVVIPCYSQGIRDACYECIGMKPLEIIEHHAFALLRTQDEQAKQIISLEKRLRMVEYGGKLLGLPRIEDIHLEGDAP